MMEVRGQEAMLEVQGIHSERVRVVHCFPLREELLDGDFLLDLGPIDLSEAFHVALSAQEDSVLILFVRAVIEFGHRDGILGNARVLLSIIAATSGVAVDVIVKIPIRAVGLGPISVGGRASVCCARGRRRCRRRAGGRGGGKEGEEGGDELLCWQLGRGFGRGGRFTPHSRPIFAWSHARQARQCLRIVDAERGEDREGQEGRGRRK